MRLVHPAPGFTFGSPFGPRLDPFGRRDESGRILVSPHNGIDIKTPFGTVLVAPSAGRVRFADFIVDKNGGNSSGLALGVDADDGRTFWSFSHLSAVYVSPGDVVVAGQRVAESGDSGTKADGSPSVTGPHLHFVTRVDGELVDPKKLISGGVSLVGIGIGALIVRELVKLLIAWRKR